MPVTDIKIQKVCRQKISYIFSGNKANYFFELSLDLKNLSLKTILNIYVQTIKWGFEWNVNVHY